MVSRHFIKVSLIGLLACLTACGGSSDSVEEQTISAIAEQGISSNLSVPQNQDVSDFQVLLFGNSHVSTLPSLLTKLIEVGKSDAQVETVNGSGGFLDDDSSRQRRLDLIASKEWTHIILQGQKYSQSGTTDYPTTDTRMWIATAKQAQITPILFPEHPQAGRPDEAKQVHHLHTSIAAVEKACVAPVGLAWDKVLMTDPSLELHNSDGNHASLMGNLLTALVFYEVITGQSADLLPYIVDIAVDEFTQQLLGQIASETIQANPACDF